MQKIERTTRRVLLAVALAAALLPPAPVHASATEPFEDAAARFVPLQAYPLGPGPEACGLIWVDALGLLASLVLAFRMARDEAPTRSWRSFVPWGALILALWATAMWLLAQPMEMRGTFL